MKLSNETISVLKNFSGINQNLEFKQGTKISTISTTKAVLAQAVVKDTFPQSFCVYDLNKFLDRKSTRLNSSHIPLSRMPSSA